MKPFISRIHFLFFPCILLFLCAGAASARTVTLPVHGLEVAAPTAVPISVEWDESWFAQSKTTEYNHNIARIAVMLSEISYVRVEKNPDSNEMIQTYRALGFKDDDIEWNYILDYTTPLTGNNQAAYSFAAKDIATPNGTKKLVFVILRGTPLSANEWISNINVSDTTRQNIETHEGFFQTTENIKNALYDYLSNHKIQTSEAIFLITGHSRGAALANLLGAMLANEGAISGEQLFVYTFAAPNVSQSEKTASPAYHFIWNIVSAEDIVPTVPPNRNNWKWKKFGHTLVLANYWNTDPDVFLGTYLPRMNTYYKKLLLRDYAPFKTGPFIQEQVARVLTNLYKTVESYYRSVLGLRDMAEVLFWKVFPEELEETDSSDSDIPAPKKDEELPAILRLIQKNINENIEGGFEYALNAFVDMHACESYLSWLLALNEDEAYSDLRNVNLVISGSFDCAVYDDDGTLLARVLDGSVELYSLKTPVAGIPLPNKCVLGFPGNRNLNVVVHKDSLIPTIVPYKIEQYAADGTYLGESGSGRLYPNAGHVIRFEAGNVSIEDGTLLAHKLRRADSKPIIRKYGLKQNIRFKIQPEFSYSTTRMLSLGIRTGNQEIYASVLGDIYTAGPKKDFGLSAGIGHQQSLYGRILIDAEVLNHFVWARDNERGKDVAFVPSGRLSVSYKPLHRLHFFVAAAFDVHIDDLNDAAFDSSVRKKTFSPLQLGDKAEIFPALQFGIRF